MAGNESSSKPVFRLKVLVDKKKNKVVLAEAGKEFMDVLFSFLALPMGTIVRLLEKHNPQGTAIGCFNTLYKSVFDLGIDHFPTKACKDMLLHPRTVMEKQFSGLKLNIDDTEDLKYSRCKSCCQMVYGNFSSEKCNRCGALMEEGPTRHKSGDGYSEIFLSDKTLFTITDKMEVAFASMRLTLKTLKDLGYTDADHLQEMFVDVDHNKVLGLLCCLFSSDTPLTDVFLKQRGSSVITNPILLFQEGKTSPSESTKLITVSVFTRKLDKKVLYVESGKDFVDLLLTFLVLPLKYAWGISGGNILLGCVDNLCESYRKLNSNEKRRRSTEKCMLPWYYSCQEPLLDISYANHEHMRQMSGLKIYYYKLEDPRNSASSTSCSGFVKKGTTYMVSDDLSITPLTVSSNICSLKKWNIGLDDIEEQVINISKTEAIRLLKATFMTSTALNSIFGSFLPKKPKEEKC